jgi:prepilin-type processing-associated H-X9-DG protein
MSQYPPGYPQQPLYYAVPGAAPRTSGMAITSLVLGILGMCVPLVGIIAAILGAIAIGRTARGALGGRGLVIAGLVLGIIGTLFIILQVAIMLPSLNRARETANRVKCASDMHQIGIAIGLYANENRGAYPPDLATLLKTQNLATAVFVCPSGNNTAAVAPFTSDVAARAAGNLEYIYTGEGLTDSVDADEPVLFEMSSDHGGGGNVLFGDGRVEFFNKTQYAKLFNGITSPARVTAEEKIAFAKP